MTQAGIPELRNSNRLITQFFSAGGPKLEIVINRYEPRSMGVSEEHITKALTRPAQWKIPNDYRRGPAHAEHRHSAGADRFAHFPAIRQMAKSVAPQPVVETKKKVFSLFG